jgi:hypothetical protein
LKIISRLFISVCICIAVYLFVFILDVVLVLSEQRDRKWRSEWVRETSWFWIHTIFIVVVLIILLPNSQSSLLATVQELQYNETTEMGIEEDDRNEHTMEEIEMGSIYENEEVEISPDLKDS